MLYSPGTNRWIANLYRTRVSRALVLVVGLTALISSSALIHADSGTCGGATSVVPFTDVGSSIFFCQIAEAYFSGLSNGTSGTTYSPSNPVTREQMAAFISRTLDQSLKRCSQRAPLGRWDLVQPAVNPGVTDVGTIPRLMASSGDELWVADNGDATVTRVYGLSGLNEGTFTGATRAYGVLVALGRVFVSGNTSPGSLYMIDPRTAPGPVTTVSTTSPLGNQSEGIAFDGSRIWTTNFSGSVSIITPGAAMPWSSTTVSTGLITPFGIIFDGTNIWVADRGDNTLKKLDSNGVILQTVGVGRLPALPVFDGTNIWVPNITDASITVVRAATGAVLATLSGNGLSVPESAGFDGERVLVANFGSSTVSLWKASDLTPLGSASAGNNTNPFGACSDGLNFWVTLSGTNQIMRF